MKVPELKKLSFNSLSLEDKVNIKNNERPVPVLNIVQIQPSCKSRAAFTRKFDESVYKKTIWLCGCEEKDAFFCFVCLLYGGDDNWTGDGIRDLKHLSEKIKKHQKSTKHIDNLVSFQFLGKTNMAACASNVYAETIRQHNETVLKNRYVLSKIIDILKLCGKCNLALGGRDESDASDNKGVFLELVEYTKNIDPALSFHLQDAGTFKGTSRSIQNELLNCMLEVCREHILNEIKQSSFVALMVDDATDVSTDNRAVVLFRYFLNGKIHERFWGFALPESKDGLSLSNCILQLINPILQDAPDKLVAQTYDGAAAMRGHVKIKEIYKNAHYIHCYAHQFHKLLEGAASRIPSCRIFFGNINGISEFFSQSPDRTAALNRVCNKRVQKPSQTRWTFQSRAVQTVFEHNSDILECLESMEAGKSKRINAETALKAAGFIKWFHHSTFQFWLNFFYKVVPHVDALFYQLQKIQTDAVKIQTATESFQKIMENIRNDLAPPLAESHGEKRRKLNTENLNVSAREVCDTISLQIEERFVFKNHLFGAKLFQRQHYANYKKNLPLEDIKTFCRAFPMVDKYALELELDVFYSRPEIKNNEDIAGCLQTLNFLVSNGLDSTFTEISKVLQILITMPMTTAETERCFSTLQLIKTYLRNTVPEERFTVTARAMLALEKTLVKEIPNFNDKVIEIFINGENKRMEFHFKK